MPDEKKDIKKFKRGFVKKAGLNPPPSSQRPAEAPKPAEPQKPQSLKPTEQSKPEAPKQNNSEKKQ